MTSLDIVSLVKNPTYEVDTSEWDVVAATISRSTAEFHSGAASLKVDTTGTIQGAYLTPTAASVPNAVYSASVWIKGTGQAQLNLASLPSGVIVASSSIVTLSGAWQRVTVTGTYPSNSTNVYLIVYQISTGVQTMYIDDVTLVQDSAPFDFNGNSLSTPGVLYLWSGTPNASNSIMRIEWTASPLTKKGALDTRFDSQGFPVTPSRAAPTPQVIAALESGLVKVTRSAKIFEADSTTPWNPVNTRDEDVARLIDGTVSVDYGSDERRKIDVQFENLDNLLRPNSNDGFWYDKIIKVYRGVEFDSTTSTPSALIIESVNADRLKSSLGGAGLSNTDINLTLLADEIPEGYDWYIAEAPTVGGNSGRIVPLKRKYDQGKKIITIGHANQPDTVTGGVLDGIPLYLTWNTGTFAWGVAPPTGDTPTAGSFVAQQTSASAAGTRVTAVGAGTVALSVWPAVTPTMITAAMGFSPAGGVWIDIRLPDLSTTESRKLLRAAIQYVENHQSDTTWEAQIGEFMIDRIDMSQFPNTVKVTGRDYAKKLMQTRLKFTSTFAAGTPILLFVTAIAANGGIFSSNMRLSIGDEVLNSEMSYERGTDRWSILKEVCNAYNYEIFFDACGNLVVRPYLDPSTSPASWSFGTGPTGNLVSYSRSTNDSRVFNHVVVYGDPADGQLTALPYFGEAEVTDPTSPVHRSRIGDRVMPPIVTNFLGSNAEAQVLAELRLRVASLESYELNFESLVYPWLEVGEIADIADPDATVYEPSKFLLDSLSIPLGLGSMSGTAKRVTYVGSPGN